MKPTKKAFLEQSGHPELATAVLRQMSDSWDEIISSPYDFRDAGAGVSGFIYYSETLPFAKRHLVKIVNKLNEFELEIGAPLKKPTDDETAYYNWLAWFALESVIDEVICFVGE